MSYRFVQQTSTYSAGVNSLTAGTITPNPADLLVIWFFTAASGNLLNVSIADGGAGNTYTSAGVIANGGSVAPTAITFSAAPSGTSQALSANFSGTTGTYLIAFSDGEMRNATLTNGASTCSWTGGTGNLFSGALTGSPTVNATAYPANQALIGIYAKNVAGVSTTLNLTETSGSHLDGLYAADYSGISTSGAYLGGAGATRSSIPGGIGANLITTGNVSGVSPPALLVGFTYDATGNAVPTAGTSPTAFTGRAAVWNSSTSLPQDAQISSNVASTMGTVSSNQYDTFYTGAMAFGLQPPPAQFTYNRRNVLYSI